MSKPAGPDGRATLSVAKLETRFDMKSAIFVLLLAGFAGGCASSAVPADPRDQFMATLQGLCGQRFDGGLTYAIEPKNDFAGKAMSMQVVCAGSTVRMPVRVGEDRSRTWVVSRPAGGLELRHDHRHPDGTPDAVTMYGGMAKEGGSALAQSFLGDAHTFRVFPGSESNVWTISLSQDKRVLTYHLERHARPRIEFVLTRVTN